MAGLENIGVVNTIPVVIEEKTNLVLVVDKIGDIGENYDMDISAGVNDAFKALQANPYDREAQLLMGATLGQLLFQFTPKETSQNQQDFRAIHNYLRGLVEAERAGGVFSPELVALEQLALAGRADKGGDECRPGNSVFEAHYLAGIQGLMHEGKSILGTETAPKYISDQTNEVLKGDAAAVIIALANLSRVYYTDEKLYNESGDKKPAAEYSEAIGKVANYLYAGAAPSPEVGAYSAQLFAHWEKLGGVTPQAYETYVKGATNMPEVLRAMFLAWAESPHIEGISHDTVKDSAVLTALYEKRCEVAKVEAK